MIRTKVKTKFKDVKFDLTNIFMKAGQVVAAETKHGIDSSIDIDGKPFPKLEDATVNRKGHEHPLIDMNKLRRSVRVKKVKTNLVQVYLDDERAKIGFYLQVDGVKLKDGTIKHFNFFGVSDETAKKIWAMIKQEVRLQLKRGRMK